MGVDIYQTSDSKGLALRIEEELGVCRGECKVVKKACVSALKGAKEKLVTLLLQEASVESLQREVCGTVCQNKRLPELVNWKDEAFETEIERANRTASGLVKDLGERVKGVENVEDRLKIVMESMQGMPGMESMQMLPKTSASESQQAGKK